MGGSQPLRLDSIQTFICDHAVLNTAFDLIIFSTMEIMHFAFHLIVWFSTVSFKG